jgi:hypothetical protein
MPAQTPEERRITQAIEATHRGKFQSIADAARAYEVPYFKLYHRYNGRPELFKTWRIDSLYATVLG